MDVFLWIVAGLLAALFLAAGLTKVSRPRDRLAGSMAWVEDFSARTVKIIGALEVLAAIGLILPAVLDIAPVLVPLAATGLAVLMGGAAITHIRRKEPPMAVGNLVLLALAALVAWGRFGPYTFGG